MFGRPLAPKERREFSRSPLSAPVAVHIPSGVRLGMIVDLSRSGIGIQMDAPPPAGSPALVEWHDQEAMGQVAWARGTVCGIRFDRPLSERIVEEAVVDARKGPVALVGNIPTGTRRQALWRHSTASP